MPNKGLKNQHPQNDKKTPEFDAFVRAAMSTGKVPPPKKPKAKKRKK